MYHCIQPKLENYGYICYMLLHVTYALRRQDEVQTSSTGDLQIINLQKNSINPGINSPNKVIFNALEWLLVVLSIWSHK